VNIYAKTVSLGGVGGGVGGVASQVFRQGEGNGGDINITARSLSLTNGGQISAGTFGTGDAGSVNINARDTVSLNRGYIFSSTDEGSVGNGNSVNITSGSISLTDGAELVVETRGQGDAGSVNINVRDIVSFNGEDSEGNSSGVFSSVVSGAVGQAGYIGITARSLSLTNGAQLVAATFGTGDAGSVNINARDTVSLDGVGSSGRSSAIFSSVQRGGVGNGRSINIKTESLSVTNGATVSASTRGSGDGGNITVNANTLEALNGGQIITNSLSIGKAGNITLNVIDSVTLAGSDQTYTARLAQFGGIVGNVGADSGLFASTNPEATGNGGNISVNSRKLTVQDSAKIAVNSQGTGVGGNIEIQTDNLTLNNQGLISAETVSSQGGGIEIGLKDILLLRQGSRISTNAGTAQAGGDGGNITINARNGFLIAVPNENSSITANAFKGSGGKVQINAAGIFGLIVLSREDLVRLLGTNDLTLLDLQQLPSSITAISQTSPTLNGQVTINTPDTDPARGLIQLPSNLVDASQQIASGCTPGGRQTASRFIATGRGGLPLSPNEPLRGRAVMTAWVDLPPQATQRVTDKLSVEITDKKTTTSVNKPTNQIVEAQGWIVDANGDVILVAQSGRSSSIPSTISCSQ
jgi:large exoprotein involved in heme utilization and adhesion